jgi:outer membrane protein assembly factor BamB
MKQIFILSILIIVLACSCKQQDDKHWGTWRGPHANGISNESDWSAEKLDSANICWTRDVGFGHSAASVVGNRLYISGWNETITETDTVHTSTIYCIDIESGNDVWAYTYPSAKRNFPGPRSTPVIDGERLYSISWEGMLFCLDSNNGEEYWQFDLTFDSLAQTDQWGFSPSVVVYDDLLLLNFNKSGMALNKFNGELVWSSEPLFAGFASAYVWEQENKALAVFQSDTSIYFVNPNNGLVENIHHKQSGYSIGCDVLALGDTIYATDEAFVYSASGIKSLWHSDSISSYFRTGVVIEGHAYQFSDVRNKFFLNCIDISTGEVLWRERFVRWGALSGINNHLLILTGTGKVIIAEANPGEYKSIKELQLLSAEDKTENWCWATPTFFKGKIYVRNSKGELACVDLSS